MGFKIKEQDRKMLCDIINEGMKQVLGCMCKLPLEIDLWLNKQGIVYIDMAGLAGLESKYYAMTDEAMDEQKKRGW